MRLVCAWSAFPKPLNRKTWLELQKIFQVVRYISTSTAQRPLYSREWTHLRVSVDLQVLLVGIVFNATAARTLGPQPQFFEDLLLALEDVGCGTVTKLSGHLMGDEDATYHAMCSPQIRGSPPLKHLLHRRHWSWHTWRCPLDWCAPVARRQVLPRTFCESVVVLWKAVGGDSLWKSV